MTLSRIAVGVDFSPESEHAVSHAMMLARQVGASVALVHVANPPAELRKLHEQDRVRLGELRDRLAGQGVEVTQVVADGDADPVLAEAADTMAADLIVVGTHGRAGVRRLVLGSVAEKTIRLAMSSVLVARGDAPAGGYRRVIVGTDFSPLAGRALERAFEVTAPGGAVHVVYAWQAPYVEYDLAGQMIQGLRETAEAEVARHRAHILALPRPAGITVDVAIADGVPFAVLDHLSESADLVVVGSHGRRGVRRFLLGSVAEATVRHARCTVLVAR